MRAHPCTPARAARPAEPRRDHPAGSLPPFRSPDATERIPPAGADIPAAPSATTAGGARNTGAPKMLPIIRGAFGQIRGGGRKVAGLPAVGGTRPVGRRAGRSIPGRRALNRADRGPTAVALTRRRC